MAPPELPFVEFIPHAAFKEDMRAQRRERALEGEHIPLLESWQSLEAQTRLVPLAEVYVSRVAFHLVLFPFEFHHPQTRTDR